MIPPICAVCNNRRNKENNRCSLVSFVDYKKLNDCEFTGMKWFCTLHAPRARELRDEKYTMQDAIDLIKKECSII